MSAKKKNRPAPAAKTPPTSAAVTPPAAVTPSLASAASGKVSVAMADAERTPRQRLISNIVMVAVCIYIAMLYLLALDQTFKWGIFGP